MASGALPIFGILLGCLISSQAVVTDDKSFSLTTLNPSEEEVRLYGTYNVTCLYSGILSNAFSGERAPSIKWTKASSCGQQSEVMYSSTGNLRTVGHSVNPSTISSASGQATLTVERIDNGLDQSCYQFIYKCEIISYTGPPTQLIRNSYSAEVRVQLVDPARILSISSDLEVEAGEQVSLQCETSGIPAPTVTWSRKDGQNFPVSVGGGLTYTSEDGRLVMTGVQSEQAGVYVCTAQNKLTNKITRQVSVLVKYVPEVSADAIRVYQAEGYHTELTCHVAAHPPVRSVKWVARNAEIGVFAVNHTSPRTSYISDPEPGEVMHQSTLVLDPVRDADYSTKFCCQFENLLGTGMECLKVVESKVPVTVRGEEPRFSALTDSGSIPHSFSTFTLFSSFLMLLLVGNQL